jgi:UV DNA damage repair endonuclease
MTTPRIGFACKFSEFTPKGVESIPDLNYKGTTVAWLKRQKPNEVDDRMWSIVMHNIEATRRLVERVGALPPHLRMVRLGSDMLPMYTEPTFSKFYCKQDVQLYIEKHLAKVGQLARLHDVRLSFHPGQFTVLASENPGIVDRSIDEFEYHADMARMMGYGREFQDFKINVHISGKQGPEGIRCAYKRLSPEARNCITIENEENAHGLSDCLSLVDLVPIVLDIHHHWVREGVYIQADSDDVRRVLDSWRGVRPTCHYSVSREDVLVDHCAVTAPDYTTLLTDGYKKAKLRAHSDFYWNTEVNKWAGSFARDFDIMCESKAKNLASFRFAEELVQHGILNLG